MSDSHKGKPAKNKGVKYSDEVKKKMSAGKQGVSLKEWGGFAKTKDTLERAKFRKEIQKLVLERDNYTCQMCEERGGQLQVDHIQSWKDYTELRFDINNCRTLCMDCHYLITFGRKKPTGVVWGHNLKHKLNSLTA